MEFYSPDEERGADGKWSGGGSEPAPKIEIKKFLPAKQAHGRGMDNYRSSAKYDIHINGVLAGKMWAGKQQYMDKAVWEIHRVNPDNTGIVPVHTIFKGGKAAAVAWVQANHQKFRK